MLMRKRAIALISVVLAGLALCLAACGGSSSSSSSQASSGAASSPTGSGSAAAGSLKLGYSVKFLEDAFMALLQKLTFNLASQQGIQTLPAANANHDPAKQYTDVRALIAEGAKALIVIPTDGKAVLPAIKYANSKNVPVVTVDDAPFGGGAYMVVRTDNYKMGQTACMAMGQRLHGSGKVLELQGDLATPNGLDRSNGFNDCMKQSFPHITVIARPAKWDPGIAASDAQTIVSSTPDLAGIYLETDTVYFNPIWSVLKSAGKAFKVGQKGHIVMVSIDGSPIGLNAIRAGELDALVSQPLNLYAKYGLYYAKAAVAGKQFQLGPTDHNSKIVMFEGNKEDALPGPLVTSQNVNDPSLWGNQNLH